MVATTQKSKKKAISSFEQKIIAALTAMSTDTHSDTF